MTRSRASLYVAVGQWGLLALLALAVALHPEFVVRWNEVGLSNYGVHLRTVIPYTLALGLGGGLALASARSIVASDRTTRHLRFVLNAYGTLVLLILASTYGYRVSSSLRVVHITINVITAIFLTGASPWLFTRIPTRSNSFWLTVELAGFVLAVVDFVNLLHVLFLAQLLIGVGFGVLIVRAVRWGDPC